MRILHQMVVLDAPDLAAESTFWAGLLDGTVDPKDEHGWHAVLVDGEQRLGIQHAPDLVAPDWPDGAPQQLHLDLYVDDIAEAHARAVALGARVLQPADLTEPGGYVVYADPAGHPFCLCWMPADGTWSPDDV
ncbi:VOC family protein [Cellulomonas biazotea]|nr:VOC family protein [Cellulomonas biazotea]